MIDLAQKMKVHKWRIRFAFFPVERIELKNGYISKKGYYFWRVVFEIQVGLAGEWTAYSHMNDGIIFSNA